MIPLALPIGAGVYLTPNAVRHLERVGLGPATEKWGARVGPNSHYFRHDGSPIAPVQVADASGIAGHEVRTTAEAFKIQAAEIARLRNNWGPLNGEMKISAEAAAKLAVEMGGTAAGAPI